MSVRRAILEKLDYDQLLALGDRFHIPDYPQYTNPPYDNRENLREQLIDALIEIRGLPEEKKGYIPDEDSEDTPDPLPVRRGRPRKAD